jgi:dihydroorotase (multifunctional complex type)
MLIRGGTVVLATGPENLDVRTHGEQIVELGKSLHQIQGEEVVEAEGLLVLPGLIDSHVHFREPGGTYKEDFTSGTRAALAGGVTTILDMPNTQPPTDGCKHLGEKSVLASTKAIVDYGFYLGATESNVEEAASLVDEVVGMKMYLGSTTGTLLLTEFRSIYQHFSTFPPHKPMVVHAEDELALRYFSTQGSKDHNRCRPPLCAQIALDRALAIAEATSRMLHIAHVSTAKEMEIIRGAKARGVQVTCEVTPQHLFLTEEDAHRLGNYGKVNPPLRNQQDQKALWANLNYIDTVASDHAPHTKLEKEQDYSEAPAGMPNIQVMLPLLLTAAGQGLCSLAEIIERSVTNPARLFRLCTKGALEVGEDADIVLVDLRQEYRLSAEQTLSRCGWLPFDGWKVKGRVLQVYLRGKLSYDNGVILAQPGSGRRVRLQ